MPSIKATSNMTEELGFQDSEELNTPVLALRRTKRQHYVGSEHIEGPGCRAPQSV